MQKIVIDTNVLVSSLLTKGYPFRIIFDLVLEKKVLLCLSEKVWEEYVEVLNRKKFSEYHGFKTNAEIVLSKINDLSVKFYPDAKLSLINDEPDNRLLELAVSAKADFLITGNTNDFTFSEYGRVKITEPAIYWETSGKYIIVVSGNFCWKATGEKLHFTGGSGCGRMLPCWAESRRVPISGRSIWNPQDL